MKKNFAIWAMLICCLTLIALRIFYFRSNQKVIVERAWSQLSNEEKVEVSEKDVTVEKIKVPQDNSTYYVDESFNGDKVYLVTFKTKNADLNGDIEELIDIKTKKVVGYSLRD